MKDIILVGKCFMGGLICVGILHMTLTIALAINEARLAGAIGG